MEEGGSPEKDKRRSRSSGVTRSYANEERTLDDLALEAEKRLAARRKARAEARTLRLQEKLQEYEESQEQARLINDTREVEEAQRALEEVRARALERQKKEQAKSKEDQTATAQDLLEEVNAMTRLVAAGPDASNATVVSLLERLKTMQTQYRESLLHQNRLQNHKVRVAFELDRLQDRVDELDEEVRSLRLSVQKKSDMVSEAQFQAKKHEATSGELAALLQVEKDKVAALEKKLGGKDSSAESEVGSAEVKELRDEVASLKAQLAAAASAQSASPASGTGAQAEAVEVDDIDTTGLDPVAASRMTRLAGQVKRLKEQLKESEENEDEAKKEARKVQRELRKAKEDIAELEVKYEAAQSQLKKIRDRRRRQMEAEASLTGGTVLTRDPLDDI